MKPSIVKLLQRQQGAATMIVVSVLAIAMALVALTISNTGLMEQRISGNDLRAREAQEAAEAGLNYGIAWAGKHSLPDNLVCSPGSLPSGCPAALSKITGSSTGEHYSYSLIYTKTGKSIKVTSTATGDNDQSISANSEVFIKQIPKGLFDSGSTMPPPWVVNGCMAKLTGTPNMILLSADSKAMVTSLASVDLSTMVGAALLTPQQLLGAALKLCLDVNLLGIHLGVNLAANAEILDKNGKISTDLGSEIKLDQAKNTDSFKCAPNDANCAWNEFFKVGVDAAINAAVDTNQIFNEHDQIPCGPAVSISVYVVNKKNAINPADMTGDCGDKKIPGVDDNTIGSPDKPVVLIIPKADGCPGFNGGMTVYGIIYFESSETCKANGWGNAKIFGSVMWESDVEKVNANTVFIETDYTKKGTLNQVFNLGVEDAVRLPGTWKDF